MEVKRVKPSGARAIIAQVRSALTRCRGGLLGYWRSAVQRVLRGVGLGLLAAVSSQAWGVLPGSDHALQPVALELVLDQEAVQPGVPFTLAVRLRHAAAWHTYWRNPGEAGLATQRVVEAPAGSQVGPMQWPVPIRLVEGGLGIYGYTDEVLLPWSMTLPADLTAAAVPIVVQVQWLACHDVCVPGEARLTREVRITRQAAQSSPDAAALTTTLAQMPSARPGLRPLWHTQGVAAGQAALSFVAPELAATDARVEFFPYAEGRLRAAAPQHLLRTAQGWRLDVSRAGNDTPSALAGVLKINDQAYEVHAEPTDLAPPAGQVVAVAQAIVPPQAGRSGAKDGAAWGRWQAVANEPLPAEAVDPISGVSSTWDGSAWVVMGFAFLGGLLLNFMPCVLPVVGLKILSFAQAGSAPDATVAMRRKGGAFALGIVVSFWVLAGVLLVLRAAGQGVGWGFQLQSPGFVVAMTLLLFSLGLNFSGVFEWGHGLTRWAGRLGADRHDTLGAFGSGCLAVLVATPCTAPFMGAAVGLTLVQPPAVAMAVFTAMGLGMALPYGVLTAMPGWRRWLPRPGVWMVRLRQALAFPMYASAAWLVWVLAQQAGLDAVLRVLLAAVLVGLAAWSAGLAQAARRPWVPRLVLVAALLGAGFLVQPWWLGQAELDAAAAAPDARSAVTVPVEWAPWSPERVEQARAAGQMVLVDFTAAWCVTCQVNKVLVLQRDEVEQALAQRKVLALRADWTTRDPAITQELARHGRNGVPLYLVYRPGEPTARILPEVLTVTSVLDALAAPEPGAARLR